MKKIFKIIYYIIFSLIIAVAALLIVSRFPITGNIKFMMVQSGSMEPAIRTGSLVLVAPAPSTNSGQADYKIGDIISFSPTGKNKLSVSHRIYDIKNVNGENQYITKGDANKTPDSGHILKNNITGKILISVPYLGYAVNFMQTKTGFLLIIIIPAAIIIFDEIIKIIKEIKKIKAKKAENNELSNQ